MDVKVAAKGQVVVKAAEKHFGRLCFAAEKACYWTFLVQGLGSSKIMIRCSLVGNYHSFRIGKLVGRFAIARSVY